MSIGGGARSVGRALVIGATAVVIVLLVSYGTQFSVLVGADKQPALVLAAIDPKAGVTGSLAFALFLVAGNFINSFME